MLPWPPVILAIISLPQMRSQIPPPRRRRTKMRATVVIVLRTLPGFFLAFFSFLGGFSFLTGSAGFSAGLKSLSPSLKSKA